MSSYTQRLMEAGDQYLAALAAGQEQFLNSMKATTGWSVVFPTPREVAEANFVFAQKLLEQQKAFMQRLLSTSAAGAGS